MDLKTNDAILKIIREFLTQTGVIEMFIPMKRNEWGIPSSNGYPVRSTLGLDLGHRSSISFYRRSRQDCVACHGIPVRRRTSPTICWQMRGKSMSSMHQNYQDNRTCHVALWHYERFCRFAQCLSYAQIHWCKCKYGHMKIDTVYRMYMHMKSTLIYSIQMYTVHMSCINIHTSYL